jgi:hypothetical protein
MSSHRANSRWIHPGLIYRRLGQRKLHLSFLALLFRVWLLAFLDRRCHTYGLRHEDDHIDAHSVLHFTLALHVGLSEERAEQRSCRRSLVRHTPLPAHLHHNTITATEHPQKQGRATQIPPGHKYLMSVTTMVVNFTLSPKTSFRTAPASFATPNVIHPSFISSKVESDLLIVRSV